MTLSQSDKPGFTLLEILLIIGIVAVFATVIIVSLDPTKRFKDARDSRRLSDIQSILSAVHQYRVDNQGELPADIDTTEKQISSSGSGCALETDICSVTGDGDCAHLGASLSKYLATMPFDPASGSESHTHYSVQADANNVVTIRACDSEDETSASVSQ